ncbi:biotin--[acetyl-CoA-carboxylase] ligase [Maribacter confluentis]|uniref:Biotin--[acetyl-CoA-carboxylase] ligase n=1 Tax=Maribacter confluentis TaxID=1656093 RepID=A0ABT8RLW1_9FLAO|nr:biotin--[acetyl-CoA-carboxylase] ligase [Maribacter confluentis]MDO1511894.1 biotin--[acetyl-CoA-carboxylase] ligase [Maribacter confluentis]
MQIIKLDATASTNTYLKELSTQTNLNDFTVVMTKNQTAGRGQLNSKWEFEEGKNLAISFLKKDLAIPVDKMFVLSISVSLAILEALQTLGVPNLSVKWPNDILSGNSKIGGILIENMLAGSKIKRSIIGFGLNVNQVAFNYAPNASSLINIFGSEQNLENIFGILVDHLYRHLKRPMVDMEERLYKSYESNLFKNGEHSHFLDQDKNMLSGSIIGVSKSGKLKVELDDGTLREFGLKEVQLQY